MIRQVALAFLSIAALAACNPYDPELPNHPFQCGGPENDKCPEGFTCNAEGVCEGSSTGGDVDASTAFQCSDDSMLEPNDLPAQAYITPIPQARPDTALVGLAICPPGDQDHFRFGVDQAGTKLEVSVIGLSDRPSLNITLFNSNGTRIATGAPVPGSPQQVVLADQVLALSVGDWVIRVDSPNQAQNNYEITIKTCNHPLPCDP